MSAEPPLNPQVSVVVLAHDRRTYLVEAVRSVASQDIDHNSFEILVVKNYEDPEIDAELARLGAQCVLCSETGGAAKVRAGVERSRGRIICVLDDDDRYAKSRLQTVIAAFTTYPQLGFYRNQISLIGTDGRTLKDSEVRAFGAPRVRESRDVLVEGRNKERLVRNFTGVTPDFNISASATSREVVLTSFPYLQRIRMTVDTLLFFTALVSDGSIFLDHRVLSEYRVHEDNSTRAGKGLPEARLRRLAEFAAVERDDYRIVREMVAASGKQPFLQVIDARIWVNRLTLAFRSETSRRRDFAHLLRDLPRYVNTYPIRENILGVVGIIPFLLSPTLGRRLYQRQMSVR